MSVRPARLKVEEGRVGRLPPPASGAYPTGRRRSTDDGPGAKRLTLPPSSHRKLSTAVTVSLQSRLAFTASVNGMESTRRIWWSTPPENWSRIGQGDIWCSVGQWVPRPRCPSVKFRISLPVSTLDAPHTQRVQRFPFTGSFYYVLSHQVHVQPLLSTRSRGEVPACGHPLFHPT